MERQASPAIAFLCILALPQILPGEVGAAVPHADFPEASALPERAEMPDPLVFLSGARVGSKQAWLEQRRPEIKALFEHYMYGAIPAKPAGATARVEAEHRDFLGGKAVLKLVTITTAPAGAPRIELLLIVPAKKTRPAPTFLAMNFCGNHAILEDRRVPIARGWLLHTCKGCVDGRATDAARGAQAADWPIEAMIDRGYALASFSSADVDSDRKDVSDGIYSWIAKQSGDAKLAEPANRGTIAAWAWGFHRCVDYLVTDPDIDRERIAAVGHSRNGKTALLAAAFDERIALAIPHQAGCGGTAPNRGTGGESVKQINDVFPHWFCGRFKQFNDAPSRLPFDQNALVALCAPRPVLFSNAIEDPWANPKGQFEVLQAAEGVYRFLGSSGLASEQMPETGKLSPGQLGYFIRLGKHSMNAEDWRVFMDFADLHLGQHGS